MERIRIGFWTLVLTALLVAVPVYASCGSCGTDAEEDGCASCVAGEAAAPASPAPAAVAGKAAPAAPAGSSFEGKQVHCPVLTNRRAKRSLYRDAKGYRVYFCCRRCRGRFEKDPARYIERLKAMGEEPAKTPVLCRKCGHVRGSDACCARGAEVCPKCKLHKGSPGCCKMVKGQRGVLCSSCGKLEGSPECCK